ncbi:MAG: DEAD/DEAH box helicase [Phycisphaerales bacterium]
MLVVHANWTDGRLMLWGERVGAGGGARGVGASGDERGSERADAADRHPGVVDAAVLLRVLAGVEGFPQEDGACAAGEMVLRLPSVGRAPMASPAVAVRRGSEQLVGGGGGAGGGDDEDDGSAGGMMGGGYSAIDAGIDPDVAIDLEVLSLDEFVDGDDGGDGSAGGSADGVASADAEDGVLDATPTVRVDRWRVPTVAVHPARMGGALEALADADEAASGEGFESEGDGGDDRFVLADSARFWLEVSRLSAALLAEQRFVPGVRDERGQPLLGRWQPWISDESTAERVGLLLSSMPAIARAVADRFEHDGWSVVSDCLTAIVNTSAKRTLIEDGLGGGIGARKGDPGELGWLRALLGDQELVDLDDERARSELARTVQMWLAGLEERGTSGVWRLMVRLDEPEGADALGDLEPPGSDVRWPLTFHLQCMDRERLIVDAEDVWLVRTPGISVDGVQLDQPQDLLLAELGRAARIFRPLDRALNEATPSRLLLETAEAYEFLREVRPLLIEQGFAVEAPGWWDSPAARLGARLQLDSPEVDLEELATHGGSLAGDSQIGLGALVDYQWKLAVGDTPVTIEEFQRLASQKAPLVKINGQWVEIRPEDIKEALSFIEENPGGEMKVSEALRIAFMAGFGGTGMSVVGIDATGWVATLLGGTGEDTTMPMLPEPAGFEGELREYQRRGMSWLVFLDALGLGPCLADDMGLGKTIQLLAMMLYERNRAAARGELDLLGPTLLIVPMSIVSNWTREAAKFTPGLKVMVHHGVERSMGESFAEAAMGVDLVVTTYALAHRDREDIQRVSWRRVVLDEAQNIKNPQAKQSQSIHGLEAPRRVVLTGTPLENRLSELWSIMDFCNPGLLGRSAEFRRLFSIPIERHHDRQRSRQLRDLVKPFILRRLKTDPKVISDLPEKVETKEFCRLTREQAELYESCVKRMLSEVERSEGIKRRGIVLTTLIRLKQICNHPVQMSLKDGDPGLIASAASGRSGKCTRLMEMLDEVIASEEKALVFTQFRRMGDLLASMLRKRFGRDVLFLHGGVPPKQRQMMVDRFQNDESCPVFILSLKAGGVGLNLTAASHVFHFDRWWNPAVENQATDRAFRIGQTKSVHVHKFIVNGTLEERIDEMIESKIALAEDVIGSGEEWLTELSTSQLRDILTLRPDALGDDDGE